MDYPIPAGLHTIPDHLLDLRPDDEVDRDLLKAKPVTTEKNIWFFWHQGFEHMHPYTQRNIRAWHRRFSQRGWTVRVLNRAPSSPLNVANFLDVSDPTIFPKCFLDGTIGGDYAPQHTSDLVRWPLLLKYGGVYADVGLMQIGDLDRLWNTTVANPESPFELLSYNQGKANERILTNYFLCSQKHNPFFDRCHRLLLALWNAGGGKTETTGMHASPLLKGTPLMGDGEGLSMTEADGTVIGGDDFCKLLTDYIIQGQVTTLVMGLIDEEDNWDGPRYVDEHMYLLDFEIGSQWINTMTEWDGNEAYRLMSLHLPTNIESETNDEKKARDIVETCLGKSFGFKLAHGLILKVLGATLGSLWRQHTGADNVPGTYAHWLRYGMIHWNQEKLPSRFELERMAAPFKSGPLLREA